MIESDDRPAPVVRRHPGFCHEGRELIDRDLESADRNWFFDGHASRQPFARLAPGFILGRAHYELSGRKGHHLRAICAVLEGGTRMRLRRHGLGEADMSRICDQDWRTEEIYFPPRSTPQNCRHLTPHSQRRDCRWGATSHAEPS